MERGTAPSSPAAGPPPPPPPVVYPWYQPPPKKSDSKIVIILVIVVVVLVIVPIVLAAVLYVMVSGLIAGPPAVPTVILTPATSCGTGCYDIRVADAQPASTLGTFRVLLTLPDLRSLTGSLQEGIVLAEGGMFLNFTDRAEPGVLDASDRFRLENPPIGGQYELTLIWMPTGAPVATIAWVS